MGEFCTCKTSKYDSNNTTMNILFFDTETTGLPKNYKAPATDVENWPRIVELSWTVCTDNGIPVNGKQRTFIIRPEGFEIPEAAAAIHGISQERAMAEGVELSAALQAFMDDVADCERLVAHNLNYDLNVISCELFRVFGETLLGKEAVCTMKAATEFCAIPSKWGFKFPSLQELHNKLFGMNFDNEHSASADTEAAQRCYFALVQNGIIAI